MGSEGPPAAITTVHVTGFKKFHGVSENPTETIVNNLAEYMKKKGLPKGLVLGSCNILETAGQEALVPLYQTLQSAITARDSDSQSSSSNKIIWTSLPVEDITKALAKKGYDVMTSDDAGRFVCNYVYYHSLRFAEQNETKSLFVHVPLFFTINEETQMHFVASLLEVLSSIC
ncbi:hypothetical protein Ahy_B09g096256 isoform B [Arachis hypogaea]|uniref:Pyrrolidone-carboxylate peptidase n=1 Tax=Arachis hypogaea TaxID=3818 RepID=A0A444XJE9_ARAHY|nr:hypothetical protein Ahy_B09g096256 isoform B [Arachis hypogaea]